MNDTSSIAGWVNAATRQLLDAGIASARLDAELILSHTLRKGRTYLHAHGDETLDARQSEIADARLLLRLDRTPLSYIIGHKEFYGRRFAVTPATLIPRPESEMIITLLKKVASQPALPLTPESLHLVDVGTGSGCLGITAKLELPHLEVTLVDTSQHALTVAEENAGRLEADVTVLKSNLLQGYPFAADYVLANLPYVGEDWEVSPETHHEPRDALYANDDGLALINRLLEEAPPRLTPSGYIFIEADPRQHAAIKTKATQVGFALTMHEDFILVFQKTNE